jgi:peptidyl-prolyl cis-trans isomerase C
MLIWLISACGEIEPTISITIPPEDSPYPTSTLTPVPPTPTPIPMAAIVNGEAITLEEYEGEVRRFILAQEEGSSLDDNEIKTIVLEDLINQTVLAQGALEAGFQLDQDTYESRLNELISSAGGEEPFNNWLIENEYTEDVFEEILKRAIMAAWMRDQILTDVPKLVEQVHVHQILLYNLEQANQLLDEIDSGRDFATVAATYDPVTQGDLGWFPRGYVPHPEIEEVAFSLPPGEYSRVITTPVGYHIIQVVEKAEDYPLSPEARLIWQENALRDWVMIQREKSEIVIMIPQESE